MYVCMYERDRRQMEVIIVNMMRILYACVRPATLESIYKKRASGAEIFVCCTS